ncbi:MAG: peptide chain release factor N(5)-glutamine methyltransferase [Candidatus Microthrix parvicella]|jgi:release factor glutamine methyltransferase|nr:peptide chain release factor N(5)-glutamine methyltransferase [Candidatus Microthrix sp.]MBP9620065.1 peptide chain release factor N(5)-glutamine methyltransferase [Candidatus Microthrix sp.]NLH68032.1 peptide chain release factor N(5)-glutamine methyltransferase [Candidatus Microthrix parvicella]
MTQSEVEGPSGAPTPEVVGVEGPEGDTTSLGELLAETGQRLASAGLGNAANEAAWMLEEVSGLDRAELALAHRDPVTVRQVARLEAMVARRSSGEPLQYVLGRWSFRRLDLATDARALIPRPETEMVVEVALAHLDRIVADGVRAPLVVDLGTGTGAIALSLVAERPGVRVVATDASDDALSVARANLAGVGSPARRVRVAAGSWWDALEPDLAGTIDLVVSNPPYVPDAAPLPRVVEGWEPTEALRAGADGLNDLRVIIGGAPTWLRSGGVLVVEMGDTQGEEVSGLARRAGLVDVALHDDLTGRPRALSASNQSAVRVP